MALPVRDHGVDVGLTYICGLGSVLVIGKMQILEQIHAFRVDGRDDGKVVLEFPEIYVGCGEGARFNLLALKSLAKFVCRFERE